MPKKLSSSSVSGTSKPTRTPPSPGKKPSSGSSLRSSGELPGSAPLCRLGSGSLGLEQRLTVYQGLGKGSWKNDSAGGLSTRGSRKDRARMQSVTMLGPIPLQRCRNGVSEGLSSHIQRSPNDFGSVLGLQDGSSDVTTVFATN